MRLSAGSRLGPYEIVTPLGAGGMGEVYRTRDTRLGRDVAVKVLPEILAHDADALARFEREARAVAALSHPNILAIHDFGRQAGMAFAVMELLEGETLRQRLTPGPLPVRKALDCAIQIANGLAAAHERGITHRDLKPENLFVTTAGLVKILDFGLARQTGVAIEPGDTRSPTATRLTDPGVIVGTVGYMSPEQTRGTTVDQRTDVFAFGCVLYEMLAGRRAFRRSTSADTLAAILREEPEPLAVLRPEIPPLLERVIAHCLEKNPGERFQSMRDVAFTLQALSPGSAAREAQATARSTSPLFTLRMALIPIGLVAGGLAGFGLHALLSRSEPLRFRKLTYQRGAIYSARFAPDGQTVAYGAAWNGDGIQLYSARLDSTESRPLGVAADVLGISPSGEMALSLGRQTMTSLLSVGRLARAPLGGGEPREVLDGVVDADWSRNGRELAVTREAGSEGRLEYPIGRVLHRTGGYLSSPRLSPRGDAVAFIEHPLKGDDRGTVAVVDLSGNVRTLTSDMPSVTGLAWSPDGREIWFSAWIADQGYVIEALTPEGGQRTVTRLGVRARLFDVKGQRALLGYEANRAGMSGVLHGDTQEKDLSWLDGSVATDLSADGSQLLFLEGWEGGGESYSFFLRKAGGRSPVRLGPGVGADLSSDGRWALSYLPHPPARLTITPTGPGEPRTIELPGIEAVAGANWFPDDRRVLLWASERGQAFRGYLLDLPDGQPRPITPVGVTAPLFANAAHALSPDGRRLAAMAGDGKPLLYPVDGGEPQPVPGTDAGDLPLAWSGDGRALFVRRRAELPSRVDRVDLTTGRRTPWKELMPVDPAGVLEILGVVPTPDGRYYAYSYIRALTDLFVIEGLE